MRIIRKEVEFMKQYILIVRDEIHFPRTKTDEALQAIDGYYQSPVFEADGTLSAFDQAIDCFQPNFSHFRNWTGEIMAV